MTETKKLAQASLESLYRIFTVPEAPDSTLGKIDQSISQNLSGFLQEHIVASERDLALIEQDFSNPFIPQDPSFVSEQIEFLLDKVVAQSVHIASPSFVGHMASALPYFMLPLSRIMTALNQNLVKVETSKAFTPLERQVIGMLHQLIYGQDAPFYQRWMHEPRQALGSFCSGGTLANLTALWAARNNLFPALSQGSSAQLTLNRLEFVGPRVGEELAESGGMGLLVALGIVMIYVAVRFQSKFAVAAVIALFHDVIITLGIFSITGMEFDLTVLAALLAIIGYSINDTIVVFDRIRENFRVMRKGTPYELINLSLSQTLSRTIITAGTTQLVVCAMLFMGGESIQGFATALTLGIVIGTYSSIYIASSLLLYLKVTKEDLMVPVREGAQDSMP